MVRILKAISKGNIYFIAKIGTDIVARGISEEVLIEKLNPKSASLDFKKMKKTKTNKKHKKYKK